jgi:hypothetical protein
MWPSFDHGAMIATLLVALVGAQAVPMPYLGRPSVSIDEGVDLVRDSSFADGTIEFDVALHSFASFAGIAFRAASTSDYELIYLRPHRSRHPDAVQYAPVYNNSTAWQLYSGDGYTAAAELPVDRWVHVKVVVSGYSARLFVDGAAEPQLTVTSLKRPWARGKVGFWGSLGGGNFSNLVVKSADTAAPPAPPTEPAPDRRTLLTWELSPAFETASQPADVLPAHGAVAASAWTAVKAESTGLVNIARDRASVRTAASRPDSLNLVYARSTVSATRPQRMKLSFAYSDAVHVFVNGRLVFAGDSAFGSRDPSFLGIASVGHDAVYVDLQTGTNEIVLAVADQFGGWGFAAKLEPVTPEYEPDR